MAVVGRSGSRHSPSIATGRFRASLLVTLLVAASTFAPVARAGGALADDAARASAERTVSTADLIPTEITLTVPTSPMPFGPVIVTATVLPNPGAGGTVRFTLSPGGATEDHPLDVNGQAFLDLGTINTATFENIAGEFLGDSTYAGDIGGVQFNVWAETTVSLASNRSTVVVGEVPLILTATVSHPGGPAVGSVFFEDDVNGVVVELGPSSVSFDKASLSSSGLRVGVHHIVAHYLPDDGWIESFSDPLIVTVLADTTVHATFAANYAVFYPYHDGYRDTVALRGILDERASVTIRVYSSTGVLKRTFSLGTVAAGTFVASWNGRTATGVAVAAGKYKVVASMRDTHSHSRTFTTYTTVSWRKVTWKSAAVLRYASTGGYYIADGGHVYASGHYPNGVLLDGGTFSPSCDPCAFAGGRFTFTLTSAGLDYRSIYVQFRGRKWHNATHPGSGSIVNPKTQDFVLTNPLCELDQPGVVCGIPVSKVYVSSTRTLQAWAWMTQEWGDGYDLYYLRLTYQYSVFA